MELRINSSRRGFTIIEMVIVAGIIALLIGLLVPAIHAIRRQARASQCQNHLHFLGQAYTERVLTRGRPGEAPWAWQWHRELAEYVDNVSEMYSCPEAYLGAAQPDASARFERIVNHQDYGNNIYTHKVPFNSGNLHFKARAINPAGASPKNDNAAYVMDFSRAERSDEVTMSFLIEPRSSGANVTMATVNDPANYGDPKITSIVEYRVYNSGENLAKQIKKNDTAPIGPFSVQGIPPLSFGMNSGVERFTQDDNRILLIDYYQIVANGSKKVEEAHAANNFGDGQLDNWNGSTFTGDPAKDWDPTDNDPPPPTYAPRHNGLSNVLFAGGNVKRLNPVDLNPNVQASQLRYWTPHNMQ